MQHPEQQMFGGKAAVAAALGLGLRGHDHASHDLFGEFHGVPLYFACTDWQDMPSASPICSHDQPCSLGPCHGGGLDLLGEAAQRPHGTQADKTQRVNVD